MSMDISRHAGIPPARHAGIHPHVYRMTDRCKNITLATTSLRPVKMGLMPTCEAIHNGIAKYL